ncbi:MAG: transporter substrate-binding domain-containing protein, partial [Planctomycetota bacterium]
MLRTALLLALLALVSACSEPSTPDPATDPAAEPETVTWDDGEHAPALVLRVTKPFTEDWDRIRERKVLRVLVSYSRTNFFIAQGRIRGFEAELFHELEKHLAKSRRKDEPPIRIAFIPHPFEQLIPSLLAGYGDVAAAALTITPGRSAKVAFTDPYLTGVDQVLVTHAGAPAVSKWEDLAGKRVHVVAGTSYEESLAEVNRDLAAAGLAPIVVETFGRGFATEDVLEMVHSGAISYTVADRYLAELWAEALDGLRIASDVALRGGDLAWAVRPGNRKLKEMLDGFVAGNR